jgi:DNA-binding NtrC family response regulator
MEAFSLQILEKMGEKWPDPRYPLKPAIPVVAIDFAHSYDFELIDLGVQEIVEWNEPDPEFRISWSKGRQHLADCLTRYGLLYGSQLPTVDASGGIQWDEETVPIIGRSRALLYALREARRAAKAEGPAPCLVMGPSGSGKELFAAYIHRHSARSKKDFLAFNCAGWSETVLVSTLFGHEKGAFTDAKEAKPGLFEMADGGTLFLDEIGDMSPLAQAMVLKAIETGAIQPLGREPKRVDVRVIAATNKDLKAMAERGEFRYDLRARLNRYVVQVPSLKERVEDIPVLFKFFLVRESCKIKSVGAVWKKLVDDCVYTVLREKPWDSNVRELEHLASVIANERANVSYIGLSDIPVEYLLPAEEVSAELAADAQQPRVRLEDTLEARAPEDIGELRDALPRVQAAYGRQLERVLSKALDATRDHTCSEPHPIYGDLVPTSAMKLLQNKLDLKSTDAKREFHRLGKMLPEAPSPDSDLGKVLKWAATGDKTERTRSKKNKLGDTHKRQEHVQKD